MKKFFSLAVVAAALAASVGCDDKPKTGGDKGSGSASKPSGAGAPSASSGGAAAVSSGSK